MKNNITYTNFHKFVYVHIPSCMKRNNFVQETGKIVYEVLHSYTNLKLRVLKFINGFWAGKDSFY